VERCEECRRTTVHFRRPGGWPVCGICGAFASRAGGRREIVARRGAPLLAQALLDQALLAQAAC
jgi:hypothetical protein